MKNLRALLLLSSATIACTGAELQPYDAPARVERRPAPPRAEAPAEREWATPRDVVLEEVNRVRRRAGRDALARDPALERAAQRHAEDMAARGFFDHQNPEGQSPRARVEAAGYGRAAIVGENLGRETLGLGRPAPEEVVERWLASPPHRKILLDRRFSETGVGLAASQRGGRTEYFWVQAFAAPRSPP